MRETDIERPLWPCAIKKPEAYFVDSFDAQDVQRPIRELMKVDTNELDFDALCDDLDEWSCNKKKEEDNGFEWRHSRACHNHLDGIYAH